MVSVYLRAKKGAPQWAFLLSLLPGTLYTFIITSFILSQGIGFGLPLPVSYGVAAAASVLYLVGLPWLGKRYAARRLEE